MTDPSFGAIASVTVVALVMLLGGLWIMNRQIRDKGVGPNNLQALGLVLLIPTLLVVAGFGLLGAESAATLFGGVAGYIFGRGSRTTE